MAVRLKAECHVTADEAFRTLRPFELGPITGVWDDNYPKLKVCVPHLGLDEFAGYARLIEKCDNPLAGYHDAPGRLPAGEKSVIASRIR